MLSFLIYSILVGFVVCESNAAGEINVAKSDEMPVESVTVPDVNETGLNDDFTFILYRLRSAGKDVLTVIKGIYDVVFDMALGKKTDEKGLEEILKRLSRLSPEMREEIDNLFKCKFYHCSYQ
ncbi:hypothetical protein NECAME_14137 [Necator americanus]|uniref:Uncharacterized protein n=1 Tax=Necator americanus TaxID=51031 RepID=W2SPW2_NECAM|nr:hypothetical protein NECAME_14137 [Necator americanus]ETN71680.1 hypothetical protein NECAME_14137 [Necator americanus]